MNGQKVITFLIVALVIAGGVYYFSKRTAEKLTPASPTLPRKTEGTKRIDAANQELPKEFTQGLTLLPGAKITESYNLVDPNINQITDGIVVFETAKSPSEVKAFYTKGLKAPEFQPIKDPNAPDTDDLKVLPFSTNRGIIVIRIEKTGAGSKVKIEDVNMAIRVNPPQP